ncbi:hypothetical protein C8J56DRAFT_1054630 [Mycena floridula]|nr:hypothetical protein C8J56DRAFT_1054630 [Mycena floridula]
MSLIYFQEFYRGSTMSFILWSINAQHTTSSFSIMLLLFVMQFQALLTVFPRSYHERLIALPCSVIAQSYSPFVPQIFAPLFTQFGILWRSHAYGAQVSGAHSSSAPRIHTMIFGINISRCEAPAS